MTDLLQELYETIFQNKLRTALTGFSVAWGIFILIALLGAGNGLIHAFEEQSKGLMMNAVTVYPGTTSKPYKGLQDNRPISLYESDRELTRRAFPEHIQHSGAVAYHGQVQLNYQNNVSTLLLNGVFPDYIGMEPIKMKKGRFINQLDIEQNRKIIVIHERTAEMLFGPTEPLGKYINSEGVAYLVVGIYADNNSFSPSAFIPYTTLQLIYQKGGKINRLVFTTQGLTSEEANQTFEQQYREVLGQRKHFAASDHSALWIWNKFTQHLQELKVARILHVTIWVIGILTLLSGIVGVSNIMLITVKERTHEFGIRKALGASPLSILKLIIAESVIITTVFGYIGMTLGILATEIINQVAGIQSLEVNTLSVTVFKDPTVDLGIALQATLTLVIAGTLAGLYPAYKAAHTRPIHALKAQ